MVTINKNKKLFITLVWMFFSLVNKVARPCTSHLSANDVQSSKPNKSHTVYYYDLPLHRKTLN